MGTVRVENIRVYARHGCLPEETVIGSDYLVTIQVKTNLSKAAVSDNLSDTVDYVHINKIVEEEMEVPSKLLEHVAKRISDRLFNEISLVKKSKISVSKINPPMNGDVEKVTIVLKSKR